MKQILTLLLLLFSMTAMAQDIIVKKDGTAIQAIVTEILSSDVKYKKFSNPNGPTYTIAIADLISITYENGDVDRFNTPTPTQEEPATPVITQQQEPAANYEYIPDGRRTKSDAELLQIYQIDHPVFVPEPTSDLYKKGKRIKTAGWVVGSTLFTAGLATFVGLVRAWGGEPEAFKYGGVVFGTLGVGGLAVGIPLICIGQKKINQSRTIQTASIFQQEFPLGKHSTFSADVNLMKDSYRNQYAPALAFHINF